MQRKFFIAVALVFTFASGLAMFAQGHGMRQGRGMLQHMTKALNLTEAQQAQAKTIMQAERAKIQPIMQQLRQNEQAQNASVTGEFDEAKARDFAQKQSQLMSDMIVEKQRAKSQIYAVLTPEQRQKALQLMQQREQRRSQRMQKHQQQPASNQ